MAVEIAIARIAALSQAHAAAVASKEEAAARHRELEAHLTAQLDVANRQLTETAEATAAMAARHAAELAAANDALAALRQYGHRCKLVGRRATQWCSRLARTARTRHLSTVSTRSGLRHCASC